MRASFLFCADSKAYKSVGDFMTAPLLLGKDEQNRSVFSIALAGGCCGLEFWSSLLR